ncbi:MAG: DnaB-like helicase C-terminal domain-containing protein [Deltaproteobacteria bacterium]|nr:DnaB-like helicase C-terminal domain-containing protein [Deltaproteobacteria bacterium]
MTDNQKLLRDAVPIRSAREHVSELTSQVERSFQRGNNLVGLGTGLRDFDALTGGLSPGQLTFVAGRPSMGKSALAAQVANDVCLRNKPVLYFSLDFGADELVRRPPPKHGSM